MKDKPPTVCPNCKTDGKVERLVAGGSGPGIMRLKGHELTAKIKEDAQKLKQDAEKNETLKANLVGEDKYHERELTRKVVDDNLKNL
jgi:hypothetical protein